MTFLPIVERELRVAARRAGTYWVRTGFALAAILLGVFFFLTSQSAASVLSRDWFRCFSVLCQVFCLCYGIRATADCLSEEKREGTLGLLFLTDLKGYDVVFGKLAGTSMQGFYGLLATFPILAVPLLLGGVTQAEFWRMVLVLMNTFLFSITAGMFVSGLSRQARWAMAGTAAILLLFAILLPLCAGIVMILAGSSRNWFGQLLLIPCPFASLRLASASSVVELRRFWWSVGVIHGLSWLQLIAASWVVRNSWQDRPVEAGRSRWRAWWHRWRFGDPSERKAFRARLLERNPIGWLAGRSRSAPMLVWGFLGAVGAGWAAGCVGFGREWYNEGVYFPTVILLNSGLKLWLASVAGRQFAQDRQSGALELILATPLRVREILRGQLLALSRQFLGPVLAVLALHGIFLAASLQRESFQDNPLNPVLWVAGAVMLAADLAALSWVAMWAAMIARNPNRVTGMTVLRLLAAPWLILTAILIILPNVREPGSMPTWPFYVGMWFGLGLAADLSYGLAAWWQLRSRFRQLALNDLPARQGERK